MKSTKPSYSETSV